MPSFVAVVMVCMAKLSGLWIFYVSLSYCLSFDIEFDVMLGFIRELVVDASSPAVEIWNHLWFAPVTEFIYNLLFSRTNSAKSFVGFLISFDAADWTLWFCHRAVEAGSAPSTHLGLAT